MNTISLLLAWRYLIHTRHEKSINTMVKICVGGVCIGTFSLALILSIMHGIESITYEKFRGVHAPITIRAYGDALNVEALAQVFEQEFPEIASYSPSETRQVIIQTHGSDDISNIISLKGVMPAQEAAISSFERHLTSKTSLAHALEHDGVVIGKKLAEQCGLAVGDPILLLYPQEHQTRKNTLSLEQHHAHVSAIFDSGIDEFDTSYALCSLDFLQSLFPDVEPTALGIALQPGTDEEPVITRLRFRLGLEVFSWKDLYPALVSALKLEQYAMFLILSLITLVASMNTISLLFMHITHKRGDIAILKAMGMADHAIRRIFIYMGLAISCCGALAGLIAATVTGFILERHPLISLPDAYYVSHLPTRVTWPVFVLVFIVALLLGLLAAWIPAYRTRSITIATVLRSEA